jgi:Ras-related GTP-binding protein C/D
MEPPPQQPKPRVLLMGARRSGKSSIQKVVFHKMSPHETLFIEATNKIVKNDIANSSFVQFEVWDFPGHVDTSSDAVKPESTYGGCGALVWVIDAQDDHAEAIARLQATIVTAHRINPNIVFEVFVHKIDSLSDDQRIETQREIQNQLFDELATARVQGAKVSFHLTSIYDHSVFEAFSKVVQQLIPQLPTLESLLDVLVTSCRIDKAFLFDVRHARPPHRRGSARPPILARL